MAELAQLRAGTARHYFDLIGFFSSHAFASAAVLNFCPVIANSASLTRPFQAYHECQRAFQYSAGGLAPPSTSLGLGSSRLRSSIGMALLSLCLATK